MKTVTVLLKLAYDADVVGDGPAAVKEFMDEMWDQTGASMEGDTIQVLEVDGRKP